MEGATQPASKGPIRDPFPGGADDRAHVRRLRGAAAALVLAAPVMAAAAIAVKLDSRGPLLFRQIRVGRNDTPFRMLKFRTMVDGADAMKDALREHVARAIGAIARPAEIRFADSLPKTRSGKIMRRLLREIASGGAVSGDVTTLEDFTILAKLQQDEE